MISTEVAGPLLTARDVIGPAKPGGEPPQIPMGRTQYYERIKSGTFPAPVKIYSRNYHPLSEIEAMKRAFVAGLDEDQLREVVSKLVAARADVEVLPAA